MIIICERWEQGLRVTLTQPWNKLQTILSLTLFERRWPLNDFNLNLKQSQRYLQVRKTRFIDSVRSNVRIHTAVNSPKSRKCCPGDTGSGRWSCAREDDCAGVKGRRARGDSHFRRVEKNSTWAVFGVPLDLHCGPARKRFDGQCRTETNKKWVVNEWVSLGHRLKDKFLKLIIETRM